MELLVKRAKRGDKEAFIELMELNKSAMLKIAYGFFQNEEDVADVMQQTILDAFEHQKELKVSRYFKTWLLKILINNCSQQYNTRKKYAPELEAAGEIGRENDLSEMGFGTLLSYLPVKDRLLFRLYYGEEYTTKEIAQMLHANESTIRSRIQRGKETLRKKMNREDFGYEK